MVQAAGGEVARGGKDQGHKCQVHGGAEAPVRPDDQHHPEKSGERRQPTPPADPFAVDDGGTRRHCERRDLQHGDDGRQRQVAQRQDDEDRCPGGAGEPQQHHRREQKAERPHRAERHHAGRKHGRRQHAADDENLAGGKLVRHQLDADVVEHEGDGGHQHRNDTAQVVRHGRAVLASRCSRKKV